MIIGIIFIIAGLLIAIYPPLLSLIVAGIIIFTGINFLIISYHYKKMEKAIGNPFMDFLIKF